MGVAVQALREGSVPRHWQVTPTDISHFSSLPPSLSLSSCAVIFQYPITRADAKLFYRYGRNRRMYALHYVHKIENPLIF